MPGGKTRVKAKGVQESLTEQITGDQLVTRHRERRAKARVTDGTEATSIAVDSRAARRILQASRQQLEGDDEEAFASGDEAGDDDDVADALPAPEAGYVYEDDAGSVATDDIEGLEYDDHESVMTEVQEFDDLDDFGLGEDEARILEKFQPQSTVRSRNLADIIMAKINEHQQGAAAAAAADEDDAEAGYDGPKIDGRVRKVYLAIGHVLKRYTSGKIPKAFKALPHVQNWEQLLFLTRPQDWSPHACYAATRIFASHLNEKMAQRYYNAVLLPIVHDAMAEEKRLHPALYMAVRKALFKPVAFYKGFLLPLCVEGHCTLREAVAVGSILQKTHLPPVPTAVVIVKMTMLPFTSSNGLFLRILVDKKMALPLQAIDALVKYFHRFVASHPANEPLPVLWHQTLLCFSQHYKMNLTADQLELLRQLCTRHFHHMITPEVRREIAAAQGKVSSMH